MTDHAASAPARPSLRAPLQYSLFRQMWLGSLLSNLGLLIQGVGAAWTMTQLTTEADLVALVQTASMAPVMLGSLAAGAIADMYNRRIVALTGLGISFIGAAVLAALAFFGMLTPGVLLVSCFVIGSGQALFGPAWSASVTEQVPPETLPSAVALNSISYNIARSFGPAIGGMIVAAAGAAAAFVANALSYIPLFIVLLRWKRQPTISRFPPETLHRAVVSGGRFVLHSPAIRVVLIRTLMTAAAGGSLQALMPLVARDVLGGGAPTYGILLGAFGVGAVCGAMGVGHIRHRFGPETTVRMGTLALGLATLGVAASHWSLLSFLALFVAGGSWMMLMTTFNIGVQMPAPRWVQGRAVATFQTAIAGGVAVGSWAWGHVANGYGVSAALYISGAMLLVSIALGLFLQLPEQSAQNNKAAAMPSEPEVNLALTDRSGPIVVEIDYRVEAADARAFHGAMQQVQSVRQRNGAYGWSISRDIADPERWTERYHCPTWLDFLRARSRMTQTERELVNRAFAYHHDAEPPKVRRMLERPYGSVRWREEAPDQGGGEVLHV